MRSKSRCCRRSACFVLKKILETRVKIEIMMLYLPFLAVGGGGGGEEFFFNVA